MQTISCVLREARFADVVGKTRGTLDVVHVPPFHATDCVFMSRLDRAPVRTRVILDRALIVRFLAWARSAAVEGFACLDFTFGEYLRRCSCTQALLAGDETSTRSATVGLFFYPRR